MTYTPAQGELIQLPDAELLLTKFLRAQLTGVATVGIEFPQSKTGKIPFVRVQRFAGLGDHLTRFDFPILEVDVWCATTQPTGSPYSSGNEAVNQLGRLVRALISSMAGYHDTALHSTVTHTTESSGLQRFSEDDPELVRLNLRVGLTVRPLPG